MFFDADVWISLKHQILMSSDATIFGLISLVLGSVLVLLILNTGKN